MFSYLDGLFLASVTSDVCQRWRTLVRDPSLWCDVVLRYYGNPNVSSVRCIPRTSRLVRVHGLRRQQIQDSMSFMFEGFRD